MAVRRPVRAALLAAITTLAVGASVYLTAVAHAATFGFTASNGIITVDSGAGLIYRVKQSNGELTSLVYNGRELHSKSKSSHIQSGIAAATTARQSGNYVIVTEQTNTWRGSGTLYHYLVTRKGDNAIYMATYVNGKGGGELRWISYLDRNVLPNRSRYSDNAGNGGAIESKDIYRVGNETRSKYFGNQRAIDLVPRGVTGKGVGVFVDYGNRESDAGGPFFRDIQEQGGSTWTEVYNYMFSGHNQTEDQRLDLLYGPYALVVTNGSTPKAADMSFMYGLGLNGSVPPSQRGFVAGKGIGLAAGQPGVVGFANGTAQYWARLNANRNYYSPAMKAGTYTATLYQNELAVDTRQVTVTADRTTNLNLHNGWQETNPIFRIGQWDGTPAGFRNADKLTLMNPSDQRMSGWGPATFTVGASSTDSFPAYQWKGVNNPTTVRFNLDAGQVKAHTVRIGITAAMAGGRPQIKVNNWTSKIPSPSSQPDSRSLTIGTYRGRNTLFTYSVPASAFVAGANAMTISVVSGSGAADYLSAGYSYDTVELY